MTTRRSRHLGRFAFVPCRARAVVFATLISALTFERSARAEAACFSAPWHHLSDTGAELVRPLPLALAGVAIVAPVVMAPTGLDHELRLVAQEDLGGRHNLEPVSVVAPYVLGGGVLAGWLVSAGIGACGAEGPQAAMLQAMVLSLGSTVLLKFAVGREWPNAGLDPEDPERLDHPEYAEHFTPFQSFGSWPSGHTSFVFAAAASFRTSTPGLGVVSWVGYPLALGVAAGMWLGDHHWASDIVSGALLGEALGSSVGYGFVSPAAREINFGVEPARGGAIVHVFGVW
ncbi:MAG TPA: phosphatase PAP2 family protein [Polyangiaceae bacterium]